eukprot:c30551_g1_i1 orf=109-282(-)
MRALKKRLESGEKISIDEPCKCTLHVASHSPSPKFSYSTSKLALFNKATSCKCKGSS